jgi:D-alanine-D-alanine ligase
MAGVPMLGSDALCLSVALDKHLSKVVASHAGIDTPAWCVVPIGDEPPDPPAMPVIVKPRYEGSGKGIAPSSRCDSQEALRDEVSRQYALYDQDLLVEAFVDGAEYTVGVVGDPPTALPVLQRAIEATTGIGLHALARHEDADEPHAYTLAGFLGVDLERRLQAAAVRMHRQLECRDFSRSDFRVDAAGVAWFLEINPLPTLAPDGTFAILAELAGRPYRAFLAEVLGGGLRRLGLSEA